MAGKRTIVSVISNRYTWEIHRSIVDALRAEGVCNSHVVLCKDRWYRGDSERAAAGGAEEVIVLPRPSEVEKSWWNTEGIEREFIEALPAIEQAVGDVICRFRPWLMILDDDSGPLEVSLIQCFKNHSVKVALMEHGWPREVSDTRFLQLWPPIRARLSTFLRRGQHPSGLPRVASFGANGSDLNICISDWTRSVYSRQSPNTVYACVSGNPYFDVLAQRRRKTVRSGRISSVLVCTTGLQKFRLPMEHVRQLDDFARTNPDVSIHVRLKPGEELLHPLRNGIAIADNKKAFYEVAPDYDLVIATEGSLVAIECVILGIQVAIARSPTPLGSPTWRQYCEDIVGVPAVELSRMLPSFETFDIDACLEKLQTRGTKYFGPVDGQCSARAASCIAGLAANS